MKKGGKLAFIFVLFLLVCVFLINVASAGFFGPDAVPSLEKVSINFNDWENVGCANWDRGLNRLVEEGQPFNTREVEMTKYTDTILSEYCFPYYSPGENTFYYCSRNGKHPYDPIPPYTSEASYPYEYIRMGLSLDGSTKNLLFGSEYGAYQESKDSPYYSNNFFISSRYGENTYLDGPGISLCDKPSNDPLDGEGIISRTIDGNKLKLKVAIDTCAFAAGRIGTAEITLEFSKNIEDKDSQGNKFLNFCSRATFCEDACKLYPNERVSSLLESGKIDDKMIRWKCTNGYDFDSEDVNFGRKRFIEDVLIKNPPWEIPEELIWRPKKVGDGVPEGKKNGDDYCVDTYGGKGLWDTQQDCVCYATPKCPDEDKDYYGAVKEDGDYLFMCLRDDEDCWDDPSEFPDFTKSLWYPEMEDHTSAEKEKFLSLYKTLMDTNKNNILADNIRPRQLESVGLYFGWFQTGGLFKEKNDFGEWINACNDGVDNDCDTFIDCFDEECFNVASCVDSCGKACVDKYPATSGAVCLKEEDFNPFSESNRLIEGIEECTKKQEVCVCELSGCETICKNQEDKLQSPTKEIINFDFRDATRVESENTKCYLEGGIKQIVKDDYFKFYKSENDNPSCCCGICEKKEDHSKDSRTFKDFVVAVLKDLGKDIEKETRDEIIKRAEEGTLFSGEKPVHLDRIIDVIKLRFNNFICDGVTDHLVEQEPKYYGLYSTAVIEILREGEKVSKMSYRLSSASDAKTREPDHLLDENFRTSYNDLVDRMAPFRAILDKAFLKVPSSECKLCPDVKDIGQIPPHKSSGASYFLFSDLFKGDFSRESSGVAYAIEPHGAVFLKDYTLDYNNLVVIFKFSPEEFSNCLVEKLSEPSQFLIKTDLENVFYYENLTLSFPSGSVDIDTVLNITKISFNCPAFYELEELPEDPSLLDVLKGIKETFREEKSWGYTRDLIRLWKGYF